MFKPFPGETVDGVVSTIGKVGSIPPPPPQKKKIHPLKQYPIKNTLSDRILCRCRADSSICFFARKIFGLKFYFFQSPSSILIMLPFPFQGMSELFNFDEATNSYVASFATITKDTQVRMKIVGVEYNEDIVSISREKPTREGKEPN